ncbi:MAG: tetratricopeptide repeat protein, partial [Desulfobacteraceae bacterium]
QLGRVEEARTYAAELLKMMPNFSLEGFRKVYAYKDPAHLERILVNLRKAGLPETPPLPLPDKPSIAVLPFVNMSGDPEQEYFSDGITEEIITALSKVPKMFVIARTSSFKYKGKEVDVRTVGRELGVRYVLEGSFRKSKDQLRITAQLVDAKTGNHLWAERYDRELKDIFSLQDEITMKIITAMQVNLTEGEQARVYAKGTKSLDALLKRVQGGEYMLRFNKDDNALARQKFEEALALDPKYAVVYSLLGYTHFFDVLYGASNSPPRSLKRAVELARKAIALNESEPVAHRLLGAIHLLKGEHEKAISQIERAVTLNPNGADDLATLGRALFYAGEYEKGIATIKKAIRLNPFPRSYYFQFLGHAYLLTAQYEEAITALKKAIDLEPDSLFAHVSLASSYGLSGHEEARAEAEEVLRINPKFSVEHFSKRLNYKNQADRERFVEGLGKAGLK